MTMSVTNVAVQQFTDTFINEYQANKPLLPGTVMNRRGIVGKSFHESVASEILMHDRGASQSDIPPTDVTYTDVIVTFKNKVALVPSDIFDQAEVNADERMNLATQAAMSIARQEDQILIDAWVAAVPTNVIADSGTNLTVAKVRQAKAILDRNNVSAGNRTALIHANGLESMLAETEVTSADFNSVKALVDGELNTFLGFNFVMMGDRAEGGLPIAASIRQNFFYHQSSSMQIYGVLRNTANPGVSVTYDPKSLSDLVIPVLRAGAQVIQQNGIVQVNSDES